MKSSAGKAKKREPCPIKASPAIKARTPMALSSACIFKWTSQISLNQVTQAAEDTMRQRRSLQLHLRRYGWYPAGRPVDHDAVGNARADCIGCGDHRAKIAGCCRSFFSHSVKLGLRCAPTIMPPTGDPSRSAARHLHIRRFAVCRPADSRRERQRLSAPPQLPIGAQGRAISIRAR
jgi:hypothetical protein